MNAARIRICDTPIRISSSSTLSAGQPGKGAGAPAREADADDGQREEDPQDPPAGRLADREPRDRDHARGLDRSRPASSARKRSSSERRPASTSWTRPPATTIASTGPDARGIERLDRQPVAVAADRPERSSWATRGSSRPVACTRTPGSPRTSSSRPSSTTRPRSTIATRSQTALDLGQQMRVQEHRGAARADVADDRAHVAAPDRVEGRRGLIEDHEVRGAQERDAQPEALLHALREGADDVLGAVGEADEAEPSRSRRASPRAAGGPARSAGPAPPGRIHG